MNDLGPDIREIFCQALDQETPEQLREFLDRACQGNAAVRTEVEALLKSHQTSGGFLPAYTQPGVSDETESLAGAHVDDAQLPVSLDFLEPSENPEALGRMGQYEILELVGYGGMGIVLKAHDGKLRRIVAIKVLAPHFAANSNARKRFLREAQAAAAVTHPHVVTIHAVDENNKTPYLVMEYVDGQSLRQKIDAEGSLELKEILRIGSQIAGGLAAAHALGLIHRDIKPANILLENGVERVRITDFGLARAVDDLSITRTGEVAGTPQYMSPEQAAGKSVDQRTDLFSLGSVMYTMCTGRSAFRANSTMGVLQRVCHDMPRPIREVNEEIPEWMVAIIDRLLAKDPEARYQSAEEVAQVLGQCLAHVQHPTLASKPPELGFPTICESAEDNRTKAVAQQGDVAPTLADTPIQAASISPPARTAWRRWAGNRWVIAASLLLLLAGIFGASEATGVTNFAGTVIRLAMGEGTLLIQVDDPTVVVSIDGEELTITGAGLQELKLWPGEYRVQATKDGEPVKTELVSITRGGRQVISVTREFDPSEGEVTSASDTVPPTNDALALVQTLQGHTAEIRGLAFINDGGRLVSCGEESSIRIWDTQDGRLLRRYKTNAKPRSLAVLPDDPIAIISTLNSTIETWDLRIDSRVGESKESEEFFNTIGISSDGARLLLSSWKGSVHVRTFDTGDKIARFGIETHPCRDAALSQDGRTILFVDNCEVVAGNVDDATELWREKGTISSKHAVAISPDGALAVAGDSQGIILIWNLATGQLLQQIAAHTDDVKAIEFLPNGRCIVSGSDDGSLQVRDVTSGRLITSATTSDSLSVLAVSKDGRLVAAAGGGFRGSYDIHLWRLPEYVWPLEARIEEASRVVEEDPKNPESWFARAQLYLQQAEWKKAADDFGQALAVDPDDRLSLLAYAAALVKAGKYEEHRQLCQQQLQSQQLKEVQDADEVVKICLLVPSQFNPLELPVKTIDDYLVDDGSESSVRRENYCVTRALVSYREGDMKETLRWVHEADISIGRDESWQQSPHLFARRRLIEAMALHILGSEEASREAYQKSLREFDRLKPFERIHNSRFLTAGWLLADVLLSEAEQTLGTFVVATLDEQSEGKAPQVQPETATTEPAPTPDS